MVVQWNPDLSGFLGERDNVQLIEGTVNRGEISINLQAKLAPWEKHPGPVE